jgi:hypothetical protein
VASARVVGKGQIVAALSGFLLLLAMFGLQWFGLTVRLGGPTLEASRNAWDSIGLTRNILLITGLFPMGLVLARVISTRASLPVALSAIATALGIVSALLIVLRIISPPDFGIAHSLGALDKTRKVGSFIGLLAAVGVAYGGRLSMQDGRR